MVRCPKRIGNLTNEVREAPVITSVYKTKNQLQEKML